MCMVWQNAAYRGAMMDAHEQTMLLKAALGRLASEAMTFDQLLDIVERLVMKHEGIEHVPM